MDHDTVATKWKRVVDLRHAELEAAPKATAEATGEPEAALGAAGADDGAAALARPKSNSDIIEPESTTELRNKLLSTGRFIGQHGVGVCHFPLKRLRPCLLYTSDAADE